MVGRQMAGVCRLLCIYQVLYDETSLPYKSPLSLIVVNLNRSQHMKIVSPVNMNLFALVKDVQDYSLVEHMSLARLSTVAPTRVFLCSAVGL